MRRTLILASAVALAAPLAACTGNSSSSSSGSTGGSTTGTTGTGSGTTGSTTSGTSGTTGSPGSHDPVPFLGNWRVSGNGTLSCGDAGAESGSLASPSPDYQVSFAAGTHSDLLSVDSEGCQAEWSINGNTAASQSFATCTIPNGGATLTVDTGSVTLTVVDSTHLSAGGNLTGTVSTCGPASATGAGTLTKQ